MTGVQTCALPISNKEEDQKKVEEVKEESKDKEGKNKKPKKEPKKKEPKKDVEKAVKKDKVYLFNTFSRRKKSNISIRRLN